MSDINNVPHTQVNVINKSLYDKVSSFNSLDAISGESLYASPLGFHAIRIAPNLSKWTWTTDKSTLDMISKPIYGLLMNDFTYSLASEWESMQYPNLLDIGPFADLTAFSGGGELGAVFRSKKLWKKSGDLTINPEIRIIDVNGDGSPLKVANQMLYFATALSTKDLTAGIGEESVNAYAQGVETIGSAAADVGKFFGNMVDKSGTAGEIATNYINVIKSGGKNMAEGADDYGKLRACPPPLDVRIGRLFRHNDMVLTNVEFTFSREMTSEGPLYVDIKLTLVTRKIISDINDTGLRPVVRYVVNNNDDPLEQIVTPFDFTENTKRPLAWGGGFTK
jgi:hypothetical protein